MYSSAFLILFLVFFFLTLALRFWLASRQLRHVLANRAAVPAEFAEKIPLEAHQKAADYTAAKTSYGLVTLLFSSFVMLGFTLLGGLQWLSQTILPLTGPGMGYLI
jgi:STE24 endopeptidase